MVLFSVDFAQCRAETLFPPDYGPWPQATPESQAWSTLKLQQARDQLRTDGGQEFTDFEGILIVNGHDIWHWGNPYELKPGLRQQHDWASCGRSLMTTTS